MTAPAITALNALSDVAPIWLRDNCPCHRCRDPRTGQKLFGITDLPWPVGIAAVDVTAHLVVITFSPDGHRSEFDRRWLDEHAHRREQVFPGKGRCERGRATISGEIPPRGPTDRGVS